MSKSIDTLVPDIYKVLRNSLEGKGIELTVDQQAELGAAIAAKVARALNREEKKGRKPKVLYMSEIGKPCLRQLWYSYHMPEKGEKILPHTQFKFLYGDILEEMVLFLAKIAGHKVEGEQEVLEWKHKGWTVRGRRDAIIDGVLIDVKSASSYSFKKFKEGIDSTNDPFGYRMQLQAYAVAVPEGSDEPARRDGTMPKMGWVAVDKQNGTLCFSENTDILRFTLRMEEIIEALENEKVPPVRKFDVVPEGKSGNMKLPMECSYCSYKMECWKESNEGYGLRGFVYDRGPVYLTHVARTPLVPEMVLSPEADSETLVESAREEEGTPA